LITLKQEVEQTKAVEDKDIGTGKIGKANKMEDFNQQLQS